jgi:hypothetical protein
MKNVIQQKVVTMRSLLSIVVASASLFVLGGTADACSVRGGHCGHPGWAANAFEGPQGSHAKGIIKPEHGHRYHYGYAKKSYGYEYGYKPKPHYGKKHYGKSY